MKAAFERLSQSTEKFLNCFLNKTNYRKMCWTIILPLLHYEHSSKEQQQKSSRAKYCSYKLLWACSNTSDILIWIYRVVIYRILSSSKMWKGGWCLKDIFVSSGCSNFKRQTDIKVYFILSRQMPVRRSWA